MSDTKIIMTDQQLTEALLSYRGDNLQLTTLSHGIRLGLGKSTPEDEAHFEAVASAQGLKLRSFAQGERVAKVMREIAQGFAKEVSDGKLMFVEGDPYITLW